VTAIQLTMVDANRQRITTPAPLHNHHFTMSKVVSFLDNHMSALCILGFGDCYVSVMMQGSADFDSMSNPKDWCYPVGGLPQKVSGLINDARPVGSPPLQWSVSMSELTAPKCNGKRRVSSSHNAQSPGVGKVTEETRGAAFAIMTDLTGDSLSYYTFRIPFSGSVDENTGEYVFIHVHGVNCQEYYLVPASPEQLGLPKGADTRSTARHPPLISAAEKELIVNRLRSWPGQDCVMADFDPWATEMWNMAGVLHCPAGWRFQKGDQYSVAIIWGGGFGNETETGMMTQHMSLHMKYSADDGLMHMTQTWVVEELDDFDPVISRIDVIRAIADLSGGTFRLGLVAIGWLMASAVGLCVTLCMGVERVGVGCRWRWAGRRVMCKWTVVAAFIAGPVLLVWATKIGHAFMGDPEVDYGPMGSGRTLPAPLDLQLAAIGLLPPLLCLIFGRAAGATGFDASSTQALLKIKRQATLSEDKQELVAHV